MVNREPLDKKCPNWNLHGGQRHFIGPQEFICRLQYQLTRNRNHGFEQLHVCGRTGNFIKAILLSHGYTVVIKATTIEKQHRLQVEAKNYRNLRSLQGNQIPVCLGSFQPRWRNILWDDLGGQLIVIDLEDVEWLKRRRGLKSTSGNTWRGHRVVAAKTSKSSCLARQLPAHDDRQTTDHSVSQLG
ncbi:hypothetical protein N7495_001170 [Penicillium taxi]|uniref:uncharacterized protein n=1 Tax=Penicillium taxi TaxID=168475 RepID=UPI0025456B23|nr:uncharacterized protein N7495_001170 [Penicillium taxi]KAJ5908488.1 hypothetical protein N7495_001170 [Penicillium taxi]